MIAQHNLCNIRGQIVIGRRKFEFRHSWGNMPTEHCSVSSEQNLYREKMSYNTFEWKYSTERSLKQNKYFKIPAFDFPIYSKIYFT